MAIVRSVTAGLRRLFHKARSERDLDDEVRHFVEMDAAERMRAGASPDDALRAARLELGGITQVKERVRGGGWEAGLESWWQDVAYGARALRRSPGFTIVALLTLALGIGANTAIFSMVNSVILVPLPYADPRGLVMLWTDDARRAIHESPTGIPTIEDWRADRAHLADIAIYRPNSATATARGGEPERVRTVFAAPNLFALLGVQLSRGRLFTPEENGGGAHVALVTHAFAERRFGGDAIDKTLTLDGDMTAWKQDPRVVRIVGVLPPGFYFPSKDVEIFEPIRAYWRYANEATDRDFTSVWSAIARLQPGVTDRDAAASLGEIGKRLALIYPRSASRDHPGYAVNVVPMLDGVVGTNLQSVLWVLLAVVGLVLLIACVNVANLLLARGSAREREFAIRLALGAGRTRILRQLLVENTLLALAAGALGLGIAALTLPALVALAPAGIARLDELSIDGRVLGFTLAAACTTAIAFGLAPAWRAASAAPYQAIKGVSAGGAPRLLRLRGMLVVTECALAVVLLAGAGLLLRSFAQVLRTDPGFTPSRLLVMRVSPPQQPPPGLSGADVWRQRQARQEALLARVAAVPGVVAVGMAGELMMSGSPDEAITFSGEAYDERASPHQLGSIGVTPGFFEALGARLLKGRFPTVDDARIAPALLYTSETTTYTGRADAVVVNESFVRTFLAGREPIGARFYEGHPGKPFWYEIVGVIADVRRQGLEIEPAPQYYGSAIGGGGDLIVRTAGAPLAIVGTVRAAIRELEPAMVIVRVSTADEQLGAFSAQRRFQTALLALFAAVALALASIGIYGVMRYSVEQRAHEIGVRVALGASGGRIARLILSEGLSLAGLGVLAGTAGALALTRVLSHWLFGITPTDPVTFGGTTALLALVAAIACWLPARRASSVDPMSVLRSE